MKKRSILLIAIAMIAIVSIVSIGINGGANKSHTNEILVDFGETASGRLLTKQLTIPNDTEQHVEGAIAFVSCNCLRSKFINSSANPGDNLIIEITYRIAKNSFGRQSEIMIINLKSDNTIAQRKVIVTATAFKERYETFIDPSYYTISPRNGNSIEPITVSFTIREYFLDDIKWESIRDSNTIVQISPNWKSPFEKIDVELKDTKSKKTELGREFMGRKPCLRRSLSYELRFNIKTAIKDRFEFTVPMVIKNDLISETVIEKEVGISYIGM